MKKILVFSIIATFGVFIASGCLQAQTYHNVDVSNFEFSPANLVINVGDTVVWTNSLGMHSVNGAIQTFPSNPVSFGNEPGIAGWTYTFIFNTPGEYSYRCEVHPSTMFGTVVVSGTSVSVSEVDEPDHFEIFPNPVRNELHWRWNKNSSPRKAYIKIYDVTGKLTDSFKLDFESHKDVSNWTEGMYIYTITTENQPVQTGKLFIIK